MTFWLTFTKLADTNFTMPLAVSLAVWLACARAWKPCFGWCMLFGSGIFLVVATKVAYIGWGIGIASIEFTGISGHAMRATSIALALIAVTLQKQSDLWRGAGLAAGLAFGMAIGFSRLVIQVHSISEVVAGCVLGAIVGLAFERMTRDKLITLDRRTLVIGVIALLPLLALKPAPTESWLEKMEHYLARKIA